MVNPTEGSNPSVSAIYEAVMAKKIGEPDGYRPRYLDDCQRIVTVAAKNGYLVSLREAELIWEDESRLMCAGWLFLPENDEILWMRIREGIRQRLD